MGVPIWMLFIFPIMWIVILPFNYIIDSLILIILMNILKLKEKKMIYKLSIFKIWILGFISNLVGSYILVIPIIINNVYKLDVGYHKGTMYFLINELLEITSNPFNNIYSFILMSIVVTISGILIYLFNYNFSFKKIFENKYINENEKKKLSLVFAIFTTPYLFFLPIIYI